MTVSEKPKASLRRGISLRPRRHIELICPLSLKACYEKLHTIFPSITTWNDSEEVVRFGYFSLVEAEEVARATGYLKALPDGTTLVSANVNVATKSIFTKSDPVNVESSKEGDFSCLAIAGFIVLICVVLLGVLSIALLCMLSLYFGLVFAIPRFINGFTKYIILTRYRDDIITAIQDGFPAQPAKK
jgi:hypothetical protein